MTTTLRIGSLFTGYGGLDMAAVSALGGGEVAWHCDIKPAAVALLAHRHPGVPNLGDLTRAFPAVGPVSPKAAALEPVDVLTFGWPCQPHSSAGKRLGEEDPRALWPNVARAVQELRPAVLLGENVARVATNGELRRVVRALAALGYVGTWRCLTAASIGAPHKRDRLTLVAVRADAAADTEGVGRTEGRAGHAGIVGGPVDAERCRSALDGCPDPALTLLPTPTQSMTTGAGTSGRDGGLNLQTAVTLLPTPSASNYGTNQGGAAGRVGPVRESLDTMARRDRLHRWGIYGAAIERWEHVMGPAPVPTMPSARTGGPQLAPAFVEWMMGVPAGWVTDVPALTRSQQLSLLGDGVVPQQMAHGFALGLAEVLATARSAA